MHSLTAASASLSGQALTSTGQFAHRLPHRGKLGERPRSYPSPLSSLPRRGTIPRAARCKMQASHPQPSGTSAAQRSTMTRCSSRARPQLRTRHRLSVASSTKVKRSKQLRSHRTRGQSRHSARQSLALKWSHLSRLPPSRRCLERCAPAPPSREVWSHLSPTKSS